ncbi:MAG: esterase-like activity of phytase family protein [Phycisphaerales bacterium]
MTDGTCGESASFAGATEVSGLNSLVGQSFVPMTKTLLLTLNSAALGGAFNPDNIECLSVGPVLPNGDQSFFLVADNNFGATQSNTFIMIAVPSPAGMGVLGLGLLAAGRRRR